MFTCESSVSGTVLNIWDMVVDFKKLQSSGRKRYIIITLLIIYMYVCVCIYITCKAKMEFYKQSIVNNTCKGMSERADSCLVESSWMSRI